MALGAAPAPAEESRLKAVFLFKMVQFFTWPSEAHPADQSPIVIGVVGSDSQAAEMEEAFRGENLAGRGFEVRRLTEPGEAMGCHVLFLSRAAREREAAWLARVEGRPVLTAADISGFAERGGVVGLMMVDGRVQFQVNRAALARQKVRINSRLLEKARPLGATGKEEGR